MIHQSKIQVKATTRGLCNITSEINSAIDSFCLSSNGLVNLFIQHTSASLLIQENADPTAKADLESFFNLLAPEGEDWHTHTLEGADDTTSHLKSAITKTSLNVPLVEGQLGLGTWQGIYLFEHRNQCPPRSIIITATI